MSILLFPQHITETILFVNEIITQDTSEHDWLEGRGEKLYLIAMIDDATSRLFARMGNHASLRGDDPAPRGWNQPRRPDVRQDDIVRADPREQTVDRASQSHQFR